MIDIFSSPGPFTTQELADVCRCSRRTVDNAIASGDLKAAKLGRCYRIPASAARRFALKTGVEPAEVRDVRLIPHVPHIPIEHRTHAGDHRRR